MKKSALALILAVLMAVGLLTIGAAADDPDGSKENPFTTVGQYNEAIKNGAMDGEDVYLTVKDEEFNDSSNPFNLTNVQSWETPPKLHLTITGCKFTGNTAKDNNNPSFMYLSNCKELVIDKCEFDSGTGLKYGINWNLVQITGATVEIKNSTFNGDYSENAIKLNQRNGAGDKATDIKPSTWENDPIAASIASAVIDNVTINSTVPVILLGSAGKGDDGAAAPSTGAFPITISNCKGSGDQEVNVFLAYNASKTDADKIEAAMKDMAAGNPASEEALALAAKLVVPVDDTTTVSKTANGDFAENGDFVASIGSDKFTSLGNAIAAVGNGQTITLLKNVDDAIGITVPENRKFTIDFDRHEYVLTGPGAGSTGTETNGFQLLQGSTITMKNGTIRVAENANNIKRLIQNYANLTLEDMTFYAKNQVGGEAYALSFNNGEIHFKGDTSIITTSDKTIAFDVCKFSSYPSVSVYFDDDYTGEINGIIIYDSPNPETHKLTINGNGTFGGIELGTSSVYDPAILVTGGRFAQAINSAYLSDSLNYRAWNGTYYTYHETREAALAAAGDNGIVSAVEGEGKVVYSVYYYTGTTGSEYRSETYIANDYATVISAPSKPGYIFMGWKCSDAHTHQPGEVIEVTKNMTFTAIWANMPDITPGTPGTPDDDDEPVVTFPFTDVREGQWFYEAVKYVYDEGIMNGMDRYTFDPNGSLTRAMVWTMLARHEGVDTEGGATWYAKAQEWAVEAGVSDGTDPMGNITREQLVTMLWRLNGSEVVTGSLTGFTDYDKVSDWAGNAMLWATVNGIIEGDEANALNPTAGCTRAQAAAMIMRFCAYHEADSFGTVV